MIEIKCVEESEKKQYLAEVKKCNEDIKICFHTRR